MKQKRLQGRLSQLVVPFVVKLEHQVDPRKETVDVEEVGVVAKLFPRHHPSFEQGGHGLICGEL